MEFICKIVLDELTPAVWRRFQFHSEITFHQLHQLLQTIMEWDDYQRTSLSSRLQEAKQATADFERLTGNDKYSLELKLFMSRWVFPIPTSTAR